MVVSNTHCPEVGELYAGAARLVVERAKAIGNKIKDPAEQGVPHRARSARRACGAASLGER